MEGEGGGRLHILPSSLISVEGGGGEIVGPTETGGRIKEDDPTSFLGAATFRATFQISVSWEPVRPGAHFWPFGLICWTKNRTEEEEV